MVLCGGRHLLDLGDTCVRSFWAGFLPALYVSIICLALIPLPAFVNRKLASLSLPFQPFLSLHEAEAFDVKHVEPTQDAIGEEDAVKAKYVVPFWRTAVFAFIGVAEFLTWFSFGTYTLYDAGFDIETVLVPFSLAFSWLYTVVRAILKPSLTPPYATFMLYTLFLMGGSLQVGGILYDTFVLQVPLPSSWSLSIILTNLIVVIMLMTIILKMPMKIPGPSVKTDEIGKTITAEDYTTLWGWISFTWIYPLIKQGRYQTLNEKDVWELSPTIQSRPLFAKFSAIHSSTLLRRLWAANSQDLIYDFALTVVSIALSYTGPFFLKRILDELDRKELTAEGRTRAYIYAFLAFICALSKSQAELQHLSFARRAGTRIRSELMTSIYDKALKRKDYSGIILKQQESSAKLGQDAKSGKAKTQKSGKADKNSKGNEARAGADIGKIVNLMAADTNRIADMAISVSLIYGAPFEIIFAGIFLYQLMGLSAFAGCIVLVLAWPLSRIIAKRGVILTKNIMAARDKRMGVLSELIGAVKVIKFFAWEDKWMERTLDARETELKCLREARTNTVMLNVVWTCSPILVSTISFMTYVLRGNQLTISIAFTAIALYNMVRAPLNIIPTRMVRILQTGVALDRIEVYLNEDEVTEQVSSLKKNQSGPYPRVAEDGLGFENATFIWNKVSEEKSKDSDKTTKNPKLGSLPTSAAPASNNGAQAVGPTAEATEGVDSGERRFELRDLDLLFPEGKLTVVTGPTASGKTALLMAVLGEMTLVHGRITMAKEPSRIDEHGYRHIISYAAQKPWLRHQSIKDNILFGHPYDKERYNEVVECCALKPDFEILEDGDETEIGIRGVNLSGGQKARVALARAVYPRTKYVLLDDPLSAVDSHTSRHLYEKLLCGPLLANRTVILVTHHVDLVLPGAFYLVRMLDGRIDAHGTVKDLRARGILEEIRHDVEQQQAVFDEKQQEVKEEASPSAPAAKKPEKPRQLVKDEHRAVGGVKWSVYKSYLQASSYWIWAILCCLILVNQLLGVTEKLWIQAWGNAYKRVPSLLILPIYHHFPSMGQGTLINKTSPSQHHFIHRSGGNHSFEARKWDFDWPNPIDHPFFYIGVYAAITFSTAFFSVLSAVTQYTGALRASRVLFRRVMSRSCFCRVLIHFPDAFSGRMLNRFGKDIETIDASLAGSLQSVNSSVAGFLASIIVVSTVIPYFLIPAIAIGFAYREIAIGYLNTGRDLRRMESNSRSPIFSEFGEMLDGIVTVRAFSAEERFLNNLHTKVDTTLKMWYTFWMTNRWLLLNFQSLGAISVLITMLFSITTLSNSAGLAGLCITSAMALTLSMFWACRHWTTLELDLNCVERIVEYLNLPQEPPAVIESNRVPAYWPSSSKDGQLLVIEDLVVKYAPDLPPVLHGISCSLKGGERIGLLGRTGSGKSTLAMSLLRFVDPVSGRIIIDGIDISKIGIYDLRSRVTFIPQDATLFSGTIRDNLDPFNEHTDAECISVLRQVHMITDTSEEPSSSSESPDQNNRANAPSVKGVKEATPSAASTVVDTKTSINLDTKVSTGGNNFSQGQRQLIAMARALLRKSSIVVLDEATSSIDFATDTKIQTTIREEFGDSLLLTVAHRLHTVIDYDRLIVMDNGKIAEFDTPWNLLQKEDGIFKTMCLKSGSYNDLEAIAKAKALLLSTYTL